MHPFEYVRPGDVAAAVALVSADPQAEYLAGGTTELDLVLKDGVLEPGRLVVGDDRSGRDRVAAALPVVLSRRQGDLGA